MKKLMIAAAIVCAAAMSQASMINWSSKGTVSGGELYATDGATKLYNWATDGKTITAAILMNTTDISQSDFLTALRTGTYKDSAFAFGDMQLDSQAVATSSKLTGKNTAELTTLAGKDVNVYYAILATDAAGNKNVLISTIKGPLTVPTADEASVSALWGTAGSTFSKNSNGDAAFGSAGWYSISAVPEPTSGLLLLLGVAGLALRRRRA